MYKAIRVIDSFLSLSFKTGSQKSILLEEPIEIFLQ